MGSIHCPLSTAINIKTTLFDRGVDRGCEYFVLQRKEFIIDKLDKYYSEEYTVIVVEL